MSPGGAWPRANLIFDAQTAKAVPAAADETGETAKNLVLQQRTHARSGVAGFASIVRVIPFATVGSAADRFITVNGAIGQSGVDAALHGKIPIAVGIISAYGLREITAIEHVAIVVGGSTDTLLNRGIEGASRILLAIDLA